MILIHPTQRALQRFLDAPPARRSAYVRRHLYTCTRCRATVSFLRRLEMLAAGDGPVAGDLLERRIRDRIIAGEHVILPTAASLPRLSTSHKWARAAGAAAVILLAFALGWPDEQLTAGEVGGTLIFGSQSIVADRPLSVEYHSGALLANQERLVLRARYRRPEDEAYNRDSRQVRAAILVRGDDGVFRGTITVPRSVVLGRFAIESADGLKVDDHDRALWSLHQRSAAGVPTYDALKQEARDLYGENFERAFELVRELTRLYPDEPEAWGHLLTLERFMLGNAHADSVRPAHRARLLALHERYARNANLPLHLAFGMDGYAVALGNGRDTVVRNIGRTWRARVLADTSRHYVADMFRVFALGDSAEKDTARMMQRYEGLWSQVGWRVPYLPANAWVAARQAEDAEAILRWADRITAQRPSGAAYYYGEAVAVPAIRQRVLARLRALLKPNPALVDSLRPLELSTTQWERQQRTVLAQIHLTLGKALLADGNARGGLDTLVLSADAVWNGPLFAHAARSHLLAGDTVGALRYFARLTVDPNTSAAYADSVRPLVASLDVGRWAALIGEATAMMRERMLEHGTNRPLPPSMRFLDAEGRSVTLEALAAGKPAIITFWSRKCGPSRNRLPELDALARRAAEHGAVLIAITHEEPSVALRAELDSLGVTIPVYHDRWAEAKRAFRQYATPEYHVVDGAGRHRFTHSTIETVVTQAAVLKGFEAGGN